MCLDFMHARGGCCRCHTCLLLIGLGCYVDGFIAKHPSERACLLPVFAFPTLPALVLNCPWYPEWLWHSFLAVPQAAVQRSVTIGPLRRGWRFSIPLLTQPLGWEYWNSDALDSV